MKKRDLKCCGNCKNIGKAIWSGMLGCTVTNRWVAHNGTCPKWEYDGIKDLDRVSRNK